MLSRAEGHTGSIGLHEVGFAMFRKKELLATGPILSSSFLPDTSGIAARYVDRLVRSTRTASSGDMGSLISSNDPDLFRREPVQGSFEPGEATCFNGAEDSPKCWFTHGPHERGTLNNSYHSGKFQG